MVTKKLISLILFPILLAGCGASAPDPGNTAPVTANYSSGSSKPIGSLWDGFTGSGQDDAQYGITEIPGEEADLTAEPTHYFILNRSNHTITAHDGTELLYEYRCQAEFTATDDSLEQWVDSVLAEIDREYATRSASLEQYAADSLESMGKDLFYGYSNYQDMGVTRHDDRVVSVIVLSSVYSGGAHPNSVQTVWNLDLESRKLLNLSDVLYPEGESTLAGLVLRHVEEKFAPLGTGALFSDYAETIASAFTADSMTPYWYFNDKGLVIFFNQYTLGPYAAGIIKAEISYEDLDGVLREEYFPEIADGIPGDLLTRGGWEGYRQYPVIADPGGSQIMIGVEGELYQLRLSEVSWVGETAIGQKMLFSANRMTQNDVLVLTGGFDDPERSFVMEYKNVTGESGIYYIHPDGLTTEP